MDFLEKLLVGTDGFEDIYFELANSGSISAHRFLLSSRCPALGMVTSWDKYVCLQLQPTFL